MNTEFGMGCKTTDFRAMSITRGLVAEECLMGLRCIALTNTCYVKGNGHHAVNG